MRTKPGFLLLGLTALCASLVSVSALAHHNDPCGMVPPIYMGKGTPITRTGLQQTYVFYKDGVETFVIRPGFQGKVDNFGMLIPFPSAPSLRKVPDNIFPHIANAVDPPEIQIFAGRWHLQQNQKANNFQNGAAAGGQALSLKRNQVRVLKEEAVGMYEVAVLQAGSAESLKKWMDKHEYQYPKGMDSVASEYIEAKWCFVAVKTKVGQSKGVQPKPGQRKVKSNMPSGSTFDGHVQGMGFRFKTDELVVPMRLSAFNEGETRNIVYLLTDSPKKIRAIPEEYVQRQISGADLITNVTQPLPLRIIGGAEKDLQPWQVKALPKQRNPIPFNGFARQLFAADLLAIKTKDLSMPHEEAEKELLRIGEHFGLRGPEIDADNAEALKDQAEKVVSKGLSSLKGMTLTVLDGDFPREVLASRNLKFAEYKMPSRRNNSLNYDPKTNAPGQKKEGILKIGKLDWNDIQKQQLDAEQRTASRPAIPLLLGLLGIGLCLGMVVFRKRQFRGMMAILMGLGMVSVASAKDPCGMVPPIYTGKGPPITRTGLQQTYVFYKDGVETFVIRPGFQGKVDNFGMLIPFPSAPSLRKVPDNVFSQVANAVDPPEVIVNLYPMPMKSASKPMAKAEEFKNFNYRRGRDSVRVLKREAVGMYEVAVLEAGSSAALKSGWIKTSLNIPKGWTRFATNTSNRNGVSLPSKPKSINRLAFSLQRDSAASNLICHQARLLMVTFKAWDFDSKPMS